jgi:hypothetical protein
MDARVSARFFRVSAKPEGTEDFPDLLLAEMKKDRTAREYDVGQQLILRIERCEPDGEFVAGDFCRKQTTNLPPQAHPDGLAPTVLPEGRGIGHLAAFRYHRPTRTLLLQNNNLCATPSRIGVYTMLLNGAATFSFQPVLRDDAIDRFKDRKPRSFTVKFASPQNLDALDDKKIPSIKGAKLLAEAFHGLYLTVTVDVGQSTKKFLDADTVTQEVTNLLNSGADIKKLRVTTNQTPDDDPGIDFLQEHLKCADNLELPDDVENNYAVRKAYLAAQFAKRLAYLNRHFGPKAER